MKKFSFLILFILLFNLTYSKVYARDEVVFIGVATGTDVSSSSSTQVGDVTMLSLIHI